MLGNPGKLVGMMQDPKTKKWVFVEAAAGVGQEPVSQSSALPLFALLAIIGFGTWLTLR